MPCRSEIDLGKVCVNSSFRGFGLIRTRDLVDLDPKALVNSDSTRVTVLKDSDWFDCFDCWILNNSGVRLDNTRETWKRLSNVHSAVHTAKSFFSVYYEIKHHQYKQQKRKRWLHNRIILKINATIQATTY